MVEQQERALVDPVDQLVPPPRGRSRLALLLVTVVIVLTLAAVAPMSGTVRPNLAFAGGETGSALQGAGEWKYLVENRGWTTATIEDFAIGVAGVEVVETTFLSAAARTAQGPPSDPVTHGPVAVGPPLATPAAIAPGEGVVIHLRFTYDCARLEAHQRASVQARGLTPAWFAVELGAGSYPGASSLLTNLLDFACDHPS